MLSCNKSAPAHDCAVYRNNGSGYLDFKHPGHIWVVNAPLTGSDKVTAKQLTTGRYDEGNVTWTRDSQKIYFTSDHDDEPYYNLPSTDLYAISASGGQPQKITSFEMGSGGYVFSPDGKQLAFIASASKPVRSYSQPDLFVMDAVSGAKPRNLTETFDYDVASGVGGDNSAPRAGGGSLPVWSADGRSIMLIYAKEGKANVGSFDVATGPLHAADTTGAGDAFDAGFLVAWLTAGPGERNRPATLHRAALNGHKAAARQLGTPRQELPL